MTDRDLLPPMDEAELRSLLDRAMSDVQAPGRLPGSALADGRRLRARRRAGLVSGGLVAAAAGTALVLATVGGGGPADPGYAGDPTPTVGPSPASTSGPEQGVLDQRPPGWWDTPSRRMLTVLRAALPDLVTVTESERHVEGTPEKTMAVGSLHGVLTGPTGPGAFQVLLYPPDPQVTAPEGDAPLLAERARCAANMTSCEPLLDAEGATVGRVSTAEEGGTTYHEVMLLGPDGGGLYFYVGDSSGEKPGYEPPSAEAPPLTTDQLVTLARDPAWTDHDPGS
jgi:hypothetical protein